MADFGRGRTYPLDPENNGPVEPPRTGTWIAMPPNYEVTAEYFARQFIDDGWDAESAPYFTQMISLIEQIRYLSQTDLASVERILVRLKRSQNARA